MIRIDDVAQRRGGRPTRRPVALVLAAVLAVGGVAAVDVAAAPAAGAEIIAVEPWMELSARFTGQAGYAGPSPETAGGGSVTLNCLRSGSVQNLDAATTATAIPNADGVATTTTAFRPAGWTLWAAHGRQAVCPPVVNPSQQSSLGFQPVSLGAEIDTDTLINLGRVFHRNSIIQSNSAQWYRGFLDLQVLGGFFRFEWQLWESPNVVPCSVGTDAVPCDDVVDFTSAFSTDIVFIGDRLYTVRMAGFTAPQSGDQCDAALDADSPTTEAFQTVENAITYGCLYASVEAVREVVVQKRVESPYSSDPPASPAFSFTTASSIAGSAWDGLEFELADGDARSAVSPESEVITVTESGLGPPWALDRVECTGDGEPLAVEVEDAVLTIPATTGIFSVVCIVTNVSEPRGALTLVKDVDATGDATPASPTDWTLTAQGQGAVSTRSVTGTSGSAEVTSASVIAGSYALSEVANDAAATIGYAPSGPWVCLDAGGDPVPVVDGAVEIGAGDDVTCTVTNVFEAAPLWITTTVTTTPAGGYTAGSSLPFTASWSCSPGGESGSATVVPSADDGVAGTPVQAALVPVGSECTVIPTDPPTGSEGLANTSWLWGAPVDPLPIVVPAGGATVDIGNSAAQQLGSFSVALRVTPRPGTPADGYTGGGAREFEVGFSCTIDGVVVASGSSVVTPSTPVIIEAPVTAECAVTGTALDLESDDFATTAYGWDGSTFSASVLAGGGDPPVITVTASFALESAAPAPATPSGPPPLSGTGSAPPWPGIGIGALALAAGAVLLVARRRRV